MNAISDRQWRNLHKKLNAISGKLADLEVHIPSKPKRWLNFQEAIPPTSVCRDVTSMLDGVDTYQGFLGKLSEYYGCDPMDLRHDKTMDKNYTAYYNGPLKTAYTRTLTVGKHTVLHEWFHHLVHLNVVWINKNEEEELANKYADVFMERSRQSNVE